MKTKFIDVDKNNKDLIIEIEEPILLHKGTYITFEGNFWFAQIEGLIDIDENTIINYMTQNMDYL